MKRIRKITSLLLALVMVFSIATITLAAETTGSITINHAVSGQTYTIYRIFDLESYDKDSGAYAYKANATWETWVKTQTTYVAVDDQGYVTWVDGADAATFAKLALEYAKNNNIVNDGIKKAGDNETSISFTDLQLGYYLVDSSLGALCGLTTTNPDATINEKNEEPTIEKKVQEGNNWGDQNDAEIGDTVNFKTTISAKPGAKGYILHDVMSVGLTLDKTSIKVEGATVDTDYTVAFDTTDGCNFEITFKQSYLDKITSNTDIVVTYSAVLNKNAVISTDANTNKTKLSYGDDSKTDTEWDETKTYTYKFDLVKTKSDSTLLTGAEFKLYDAETGGNEIALVKEADGSYRVATAEEKAVAGFTPAVIEAGKVVIKGLDTGTYWLEETKAPAGYNKLNSRVKVEIKGSNLDATMDGNTWTAGGVKVENKSGTELPSTGGMGTTLFYVLGGVLVVVAAVLLITRKRMSAER